MRNNQKNIENRMMEWEDENDEIEDDERMVKKWGKSGNKEIDIHERLFEKKEKKSKI